MVNRCESGLPPASPRSSKAPGMGHGSWVYDGHWAWRARGHEGTWALLSPLQGTDALAAGSLSLSFEHYGSQQSDQPRDLEAEACSEPRR